MKRHDKSYYALAVGTEYIVLNGIAWPLSTLAGQRSGGSFYRGGDTDGHLIRTRQMTAQEANAIKGGTMREATAFDAGAWK